MKSLDAIAEKLDKPVVFHCSPRRGESTRRDFRVVHDVGPAIESVPDYADDWAPPSQRTVLARFGPMRLFQPGENIDDGFQLYSYKECLLYLKLFRDTIWTAAEQLDDPDRHDEDYRGRINGLCPIAQPMSTSDFFAIDTEQERDDGEYPIVFLDHEMYFAGGLSEDDLEPVADDVVDLLDQLLDDPLRWLDAGWTGGNPYDQWFPDAWSYVE
ncbi:MAG: hypothetical protein QNJ00_17275 [Woeseiaceae bacterium]|nr:hypothetical protein [Woeseiaceae bacterium]